ncbi:hypothetical protein F4859DRAFT_483418 [Xylaria cf. heliscus]|nr:hypothetical protein F4859DRAFT_483418 [Xylaria cf. heliscus]
MSSSAPAASPKPEYQHFVPQFILRNFAHKYTGPQRSKKGNKKKKAESLFRGELVVNNVNLKAEPIAIEETKVSRILGKYDMYQDTSQPTGQQRQIETMFGKLESHASTIFRKIVKAFESGDPNVWVTREERNSIRKFLFILKYRGSTFYRRFHHESSDKYEANDKSKLQTYMDENNFKRPIDVWFHGLKTILNLKMDTENWKQELLTDMYEDDAMWFIMHSEMMYMAICTPSEPDTEFILTDNSYNVFEGPNTFVKNPATGEFQDSGWTSFHEFAPLSPKLMIILRSNMLPVPEEDSYPGVRAWREEHRKQAVDDWYDASLQSNLADLPIHKARNNYSQIVNGQTQYLPGENGTQLKSHKFCFTFFPVNIEYVNKINLILFDNSYRCTNIVFGTRDAFVKTLEWYMTDPSGLGKKIIGDSLEERSKNLKSLAALMKSLGSTREPVWTENVGPDMWGFEKMNAVERALRKGLADWMLSNKKELEESPVPPRGARFAYLALGGSDETFLEDGAHAQRMLKQRIKVDVHSQGLPEAARVEARERLIEKFLTYPSNIVIFFVKQVRLMVLGRHNERFSERATGDSRSPPEEPEDIIAQALHDRMTAEKLNRLMYKTVMNDIDRSKDPILERELWVTPMPTPEGGLRLSMIAKIVFGVPGLLKECGVPEVEKLALSQELIIRQQDLSRIRGLPHPYMDHDEKVELLTRVMAKPKFKAALAGKVEASLLQDLEDVMFKMSYPTPPIRSPI